MFTLSGFYSFTKVDIREGRVVNNIYGPEIEQRGVPKHQLGLSAVMSPPVDFGTLNFIANWSWRSAIYLDDFEPDARQAPYSLINARIEATEIGGSGLSAALFVNNALNQRYRIGVLALQAEGFGIAASVYGVPRMFGAELGYKF